MNIAERYINRIDSWAESAEHNKRQLKLSAAIGSGGLVLTGVGIGLLLSGHPSEASLAGATGAVNTAAGAKGVIDSFESFAENHASTARVQGHAEGLDIAVSSSRDV